MPRTLTHWSMVLLPPANTGGKAAKSARSTSGKTMLRYRKKKPPTRAKSPPSARTGRCVDGIEHLPHGEHAAEVEPAKEDFDAAVPGRAQHLDVLVEPVGDQHVFQRLALLRDLEVRVSAPSLQ